MPNSGREVRIAAEWSSIGPVRSSLQSPDYPVSRFYESNQPLIPTAMFNRNLHVPFLSEPRKLFSPFDQQDAFRGHQVVERQRVEFALRINAIEIDVVKSDRKPSIFVDERERRAGHVIGFGCLKTFSNAFNPGGFPSSKTAIQNTETAVLHFIAI